MVHPPAAPRALGQPATAGAQPGGFAVPWTHLPPHLPASRQRGPGSVPVCPWLPECLGAVELSFPRRQVGVRTPGSRDCPLSPAPPDGMPGPWAARHHSARERSVSLRVLCFGARAPARARPSARHLRSSCQCLRSPDGNAIGLGGLQVAHTVASFGWASYEALGSSPESCRWGHTEDWRRVRVVLRDFLIFRRDVYAIATPS